MPPTGGRDPRAAQRGTAVTRDDLVLLQSASAQWMIAVLEHLDAFNGQRPLSGRPDPDGSRSRLQQALQELRSATMRCGGSAVGAQARRLIDSAALLGHELSAQRSAPKVSMLIHAHRQLHIGYAELMIALGDELALLCVSEARLSA